MSNVIAAGDGIKLALHHWHRPPPAYGRVLIVHGHGEHMGRHTALATQLSEWGFEVIGFDLRGHGLSEGQRGGLATHEDLLADLALVIDRAQVVDRARRESAGPLVLLGHGLGGLIAARFVAEGLAAQPASWYRPVDALILSSPLLDPEIAAGPLLSMISNALPNFAVTSGTDASWRSRSAAVVAAYRTDPLVHDRITGRLRRFIVESSQTVQARAAAWRTPTLLLYAGKDLCISPVGSRSFAASAPKKITTTYHFNELFHELFNEPERERIYALLGGWLAAWVLPAEE